MSNLRIAHGDVYPAYMEWLKRKHSSLSQENVNVDVTVGKFRGWIGFPIHVMCPDQKTAETMALALADFFDRMGFVDTPRALRNVSWNTVPEEPNLGTLWPKDAPELRR